MARVAALLLVGLTGFSAPSIASAHERTLLPGVTYERDVQFTPHGPVVLHVVRAPAPSGLYRLRPELGGGAVVGRETVTAIQRRRASEATSVGLNGDLFSFAEGRPSGITLRDGVLVTAPLPGRSSLGIRIDGVLDVRRVALRASWSGSGGPRPLARLNAIPGPGQVALFTPEWGRATPRVPGAIAAVLAPFEPAVPNAALSGVVERLADAALPIPLAPGLAVLVARAAAAELLRAEALPGTSLTLRLRLPPAWDAVTDAIGGGPALVRDGEPVLRVEEAFSWAQLRTRAPRSAVGQRADGGLLLVVTDGRQPGYSVGMTTFELALTMVRLGAVRAMALDSGGSSTLAFDGELLNRPSDGRERAVGSALLLEYRGVYVPPPAEPTLSPNGDGVADEQRLSYTLVVPADVSAELVSPDGSLAHAETQPRAPGRYRVPFPPPPRPVEGLPPAGTSAPLAEGRWTLRVSATDEQGLVSTMRVVFRVNQTLGFLQVAPAVLRLPRARAVATVRWILTRPAQVRLTVETRAGRTVRSIPLGQLEPGRKLAIWDGRLEGGRLARAGAYVVRVSARNALGEVALAQPLVVRPSSPSGRRGRSGH